MFSVQTEVEVIAENVTEMTAKRIARKYAKLVGGYVRVVNENGDTVWAVQG
jgi:ribosomal protein L17